jgi:hypothetical protein
MFTRNAVSDLVDGPGFPRYGDLVGRRQEIGIRHSEPVGLSHRGQHPTEMSIAF